MRILLAAVVGAAVVFTWQVAFALAGLPPLPGRPFADPTTGYISALADLTARLSGVATLGFLLAIVGFTPVRDDGCLQPGSRLLTRWAGRAGQLWFWASLLQTFANSAFVNGAPIGYTLNLGSWSTFLSSTPSGLAWLMCAIVALATVLAVYRGRRYAALALLYGAGVLAMAFVAVTGNVSVGLNHDWATDAAIAVTLTTVPLATAAVAVVARGTEGISNLRAVNRTRRYHKLVPPLVLVGVTGHLLIAWQELAGQPPTAVFFGLPTLGFFCAFALLVVSWFWRQLSGEVRPGRTEAGRAVRSVARDVAILVGYLAFQTAANHIPPPRFLLPQSIQVNYLGYEMNVPVTLELLLGLGRPNLLWIGMTLVAVGAYLWGVIRVRRRGGRWPIHRLLLWTAGWGITLYLAISGFWEYSTAVFSWHMFVHMTVNMLVPALCVLGGPLTLLREAAKPRAGRQLPGPVEVERAIADYRPLQRVLSPPVLWLNYVGSLFLVYYTPLFPWLMRYHWAHQLMLLYFMVTGYVFFNLVVGIDRDAWNLPHLVKLALVISIMPFHAIFAVGIMSARSLFGADFYHSIDVGWVGDLMADQNVAGQITWLMGELPLLIVIIALAAQWFAQDKRDSGLFDHAQDSGTDDSFDAYNDMLNELAERDRAEQRSRLQREQLP